jgi:hypothetical protein
MRKRVNAPVADFNQFIFDKENMRQESVAWLFSHPILRSQGVIAQSVLFHHVCTIFSRLVLWEGSELKARHNITLPEHWKIIINSWVEDGWIDGWKHRPIVNRDSCQENGCGKFSSGCWVQLQEAQQLKQSWDCTLVQIDVNEMSQEAKCYLLKTSKESLTAINNKIDLRL